MVTLQSESLMKSVRDQQQAIARILPYTDYIAVSSALHVWEAWRALPRR